MSVNCYPKGYAILFSLHSVKELSQKINKADKVRKNEVENSKRHTWDTCAFSKCYAVSLCRQIQIHKILKLFSAGFPSESARIHASMHRKFKNDSFDSVGAKMTSTCSVINILLYYHRFSEISLRIFQDFSEKCPAIFSLSQGVFLN